MFRKQELVVVFVLTILLFSFVFAKGCIAAPSVELKIEPNDTVLYAGSDEVTLIALVNGENLKFKWELIGPGELEDKGSTALYVAPKEIENEPTQAIITVTVSDETGQKTTKTITFSIVSDLPSTLTLIPTPTPVSSPTPKLRSSRRGLGKKVLLGIGAAALLGGGVGLSVGGGDGDDAGPSFTGRFQRDYSGVSSRGNPYTGTYVFDLMQSGNLIAGNLINTSTLIDCCTTVTTVPVTGTIEENSTNSAFLSWGPGEGRCECSEWTWTSGITADSDHVILINDERILRFDKGADFTRTSKVNRAEFTGKIDEDGFVEIGGDFIRQ